MSSIRWVRVVSIGIVLCALAGSVAHAVAVPLFGSADEVGHFDYAYQVWHGHLPDFYAGIVVNQVKGSSMPVQWVSQHPPLFYALLAPIVGPLTDAGHIHLAGMLARGVNILIGSTIPLAIIWSFRRAFPGRITEALLAGLIVATSPWLHGVSGAVYNDALAALLATLLIGVSSACLREHPTRRSWTVFILLAAAAMLTRLALVVIVAACVGAMVVATLRRGHRALVQAFLGVTATCVAVVATSGWFYWHNVQVSGSITGGHPDWAAANLGRQVMTLTQVLSTPSTWTNLLGLFWVRSSPAWHGFLLLIVPCGIGCAALVLRSARGRTVGRDRLPIALWGLIVLGVIAMQIKYKMGGGALNPRYILPLFLPISALMSHGLLSVPRLVCLLPAVWVCATALLTIDWSLLTTAVGGANYPNAPGLATGATVLFLLALGATVLALTAGSALVSETMRDGVNDGA